MSEVGDDLQSQALAALGGLVIRYGAARVDEVIARRQGKALAALNDAELLEACREAEDSREFDTVEDLEAEGRARVIAEGAAQAGAGEVDEDGA